MTSRMRKEKSGWPHRVKVGYGRSSKSKGLHPQGLSEILVTNLSDLDGVTVNSHIVRLSRRLGERKRLLLLDKVRQMGLRVANPGRREAAPVEEGRSSEQPEPRKDSQAGADEPVQESATPEESPVGDLDK